MVLIGGVKYACERCIRGHRVTTCNHTDQPLMMIKPKGRPSSQCKHCKELRKNKNSHPSGACTCGKNKKPVNAVVKCTCKTGEPCTCHGRRKRNDSKPSLSRLSTSDITSPQPESSSSVNLPSSSSFSWTNSSISLTPQQQQQSNGKVRQIGMDPLANARPAGQSTRTRVGEVSVPINEYIPNTSNGIGNVNDKIPDVFFQDIPLPFEPGHGLLDLFANSNMTSVNPYFHENPNNEQLQQHQQQQQKESTRMFSPTSNSTNSDNMVHNNVRSPSDASNNQNGGLFSTFSNNSNNGGNNNMNQIGSPESKISNTPFPRNDSMMSLSSVESNSQLSQMSKINGSSDSLTSGNYHHYDSMIHKPSSQKFTFPNNNNNPQNYPTVGTQNNGNNNNNDDAASVQSVEVLSLTPSFLDIPTDFKNEQGYFANSHHNSNNSNNSNNNQQHQSNGHRFTPSIDSLQSSNSANYSNKFQDHQSTVPQIHSNLINASSKTDEDDENMLTPREPGQFSNGEGSDKFTENNSFFNNFNTELTTSGL